MPRGWEGNRRTGHASQTQVVYPPTGQSMGDEHPAYARDRARPGLPLPLGPISLVRLLLQKSEMRVWL